MQHIELCSIISIWFCSQKCLTTAWKGRHNKCLKPVVHVLLESKAEALEEIATVGYIEVLNHFDEPVVLVQDIKTGELFNSLRDETAVFDARGISGSSLVFHNRQNSPVVQQLIAQRLSQNKSSSNI